MRAPLSFRFAVLCLLGGLPHARGDATSASDPTGSLTLRVNAQSDLRVALPFHQASAFEGTIAAVAGGVVSFTHGASWTNWAANQWVRVPGTQENTYFLLVMTGVAEGASATVATSGTDSVTLASALSGLAAGDTAELIPCWTLSTLFPGGAGATGTTSIGGVGAPTQILTIAPVPGVNFAPNQTFFYYTGSSFGGPGWRLVGSSPTGLWDHQPFATSIALIYRNATSQAVDWTVSGAVQLASNRASVGVLSPSLAQDNLMSLQVAAPVTLGASALIGSGAMAATTSIGGVNADELLTFNASGVGFNSAPSATYFYYSGSSFGGPGWRLVGASPLTLQDSQEILQPGQAFIIRTAPRVAATQTAWVLLPGYLH